MHKRVKSQKFKKQNKKERAKVHKKVMQIKKVPRKRMEKKI